MRYTWSMRLGVTPTNQQGTRWITGDLYTNEESAHDALREKLEAVYPGAWKQTNSFQYMIHGHHTGQVGATVDYSWTKLEHELHNIQHLEIYANDANKFVGHPLVGIQMEYVRDHLQEAHDYLKEALAKAHAADDRPVRVAANTQD